MTVEDARDSAPQITKVIHWTDGTVGVWDQHGRRMPQYEGDARTAIPKILATGWREGIPIVQRPTNGGS